MVAAIVIPILFFVFFIVTKKERKKYDRLWKRLGDVEEIDTVKGIVASKITDKKRFYQHRYYVSIEFRIQTNTNKSIRAIYEKPIQFTEEVEHEPPWKTGDALTLYGSWDNQQFRVNRIKEGLEQ